MDLLASRIPCMGAETLPPPPDQAAVMLIVHAVLQMLARVSAAGHIRTRLDITQAKTCMRISCS